MCGVDASENVVLDVKLPNGITREIKGEFDPFTGHTFTYDAYPDDPIGSYQFIFRGHNWQIQKEVIVVDNHLAKMFIKENKLILYGFKPNEPIRVFAYLSGGSYVTYDHGYKPRKLAGWQAYQVNENGSLIIELDGDLAKQAIFFVVGSLSGPADEWIGKVFDYSNKNAVSIFCPGAAAPVGIQSHGGYALVITDQLPYTGFDYYSDTQLEGFLPKGTIVKIQSNPFCEDGQFKWDVTTCLEKYCGQSLTISEANEGSYYLTPVESPIQSLDLPEFKCSGARPTRLNPGITARVSKNAIQINLREKAGMDAHKVNVIASGRLIKILNDAPVCANNAFWWHVTVPELGFEGWVREGDNEEYWIDPLP